MTLRHIVTWKLSGQNTAELDAQAAEITAVLLPMGELIPTIRTINVHRNELFDEKNWHLTMMLDFDDADGLTAYIDHPEHLKVFPTVRQYSVARNSIDFYV